MRLLLVTPPMTQPNTPYPATAYLMGCLRLHAGRLGLDLHQADAGLELFLRLFSREGVGRILAELHRRAEAAGGADMPATVAHLLSHGDGYIDTIDAALRYLQGRDPALALRIVSREWLPEGPRFAVIDETQADDEEPLAWAFGALGTTDRARYLASLYLDDLGDAVRDGIDQRFGLSRYGEHLAAS